MVSGWTFAGGDKTLIEEDSVHSISASLILGREGTKCLDRRAPVRRNHANEVLAATNTAGEVVKKMICSLRIVGRLVFLQSRWHSTRGVNHAVVCAGLIQGFNQKARCENMAL